MGYQPIYILEVLISSEQVGSYVHPVGQLFGGFTKFQTPMHLCDCGGSMVLSGSLVHQDTFSFEIG